MDNVTVASARPAMPMPLVVFWLLVVGGLNWLLVGLLRVDLVAAIFGADSLGRAWSMFWRRSSAPS